MRFALTLIFPAHEQMAATIPPYSGVGLTPREERVITYSDTKHPSQICSESEVRTMVEVIFNFNMLL